MLYYFATSYPVFIIIINICIYVIRNVCDLLAIGHYVHVRITQIHNNVQPPYQ